MYVDQKNVGASCFPAHLPIRKRNLPALGWVADGMEGTSQDGMPGNRLDTLEVALLRSLPEMSPTYGG